MATHYPKRGKGQRWTQADLRAIPTAWKGETISDGDGLNGEVRVSTKNVVSVRFRYAFKWEGQLIWHQCGSWPATSLAEVRTRRDTARSLLRAGVNPNDQKKANQIVERDRILSVIAEDERKRTENLWVQDLFNVWIFNGVARGDGNAAIKRTFMKDVLPAIGQIPLRELKDQDIRALLRAVISRGCNRLAVAILVDLGQMLLWAEKCQPWRKLLAEGNPAALVKPAEIVTADYDLSNERDRVLSDEEIRELHGIFVRTEEDYEAAANRRTAKRPLSKNIQLALWICLSTACRDGELLLTEWAHVDFDKREWFIPKENTKGRRGKKQPQTVFIYEFTLRMFKALQTLSGNNRWCFPARHNEGPHEVGWLSKQVSNRQTQFSEGKPLKGRVNDNSLVLAEGKNGNWIPNDLRRTGATIMQSLGVSLDVIDRCQNHVIKGSRVRRHYMRHEYAAEKTEAWRRLGVYLTSLLVNDPNNATATNT